MTQSAQATGSARPGSGRATTYLYLALGMILFGSATPVSKLVTQELPVFVAALLRALLGTLLLLPPALARWDALSRLSRRDWLLVLLIALFGMVGFSAFMLYGMRLVPGTVGAVVMSTTPAVTGIGAVLFLGEHPGWRRVVALLLAVAGVLLLQLGGGNAEGGGRALLGALLVFGAVCCEAA